MSRQDTDGKQRTDAKVEEKEAEVMKDNKDSKDVKKDIGSKNVKKDIGSKNVKKDIGSKKKDGEIKENDEKEDDCGFTLLTDEDFVRVHEESIEIIDSKPNDEWKCLVNTGNVIAYSKSLDPTRNGVKQVRSVTVINGYSGTFLFNLIYNASFSDRWSTAWSEQKIGHKINNLNEFIYLVADTPFFISKRDFVQVRSYTNIDGVYVIAFRNAKSDKFPQRKSHIRGRTLDVVGYTIHETGKPKGIKDDEHVHEGYEVKITITTCFDLEGYIPYKAVNYVAGKAPHRFRKNLQDACKKFAKKDIVKDMIK